MSEYKKAIKIINTLNKQGYEGYIVGGYVRDTLLGAISNDVDIVTNATPLELEDIFKGFQVDTVGKNFGVTLVMGVEVATYRGDSYEGHKGKPEVTYVNSYKEDSERRDYTINAMYMDKDGEVHDPVGGKDSINKKELSTVGDSDARYKEDPSRILRGLYLTSKLGKYTGEEGELHGVSHVGHWGISASTKEGMKRNKELLQYVPTELQGKILSKVLHEGVLTSYIKQQYELGLLGETHPELLHLIGLEQNKKYHLLDAWGHTLTVLAEGEKYLSKLTSEQQLVFQLSLLYHDIGKGKAGVREYTGTGLPSDIGHEEYGSELAYQSVVRLGLGKDIARQVRLLVKTHGMLRVSMESKRPKRTVGRVINKLSHEVGNKKALKELLYILQYVVKSDMVSFTPTLQEEVNYGLEQFTKYATEHLRNTYYYTNELSVTGRDALALGLRGKHIGYALEYVLLYSRVQEEDKYEKQYARLQQYKERELG